MAEKIKLLFLGTGSAIPTKRRNHPAMLLSYKDSNILIDCGEGTQRQFRYKGENPCKITNILITHWHGDHVLGLPGLLQTLMLNGYNKTLKIYGPRGSKKMLSLYLSLFVNQNKINIETHEIEEGKVFENEDFLIESEKMEHETPALAYSFIIKEKIRLDKDKLKKLKLPSSPLIGELRKGKTIEINGKKIDGKKLIYKEDGKKISFIMDTVLNKNCDKIAKEADLLVCESTYSDEEEQLAKEHFHLTAGQAGRIAKNSEVKKLVLMHLSQKYEVNSKIILQEARKVFKNTELAEDLMSFDI